jgi:diadenosine tetraphosphatase ApaH/serine/threonine PP2A family protein phosphatase
LTRILVISDIHANLTALQAVLVDAGKIDAAWCLGDLVGYGPDPNECITLVRELPNLVCLKGNHDLATIGGLGLETFNGDAHRSILWQRSTLSEENKEFLKSLPNKIKVDENVTLTHGSPRDPTWEYIMDTEIARQNRSYVETPLCFFGHTHYPVMYSWKSGNDYPVHEIPTINKKQTLPEIAFLNPGSVGQPRDRDARSAYAIYDPLKRTWLAKRVTYDIKQVQERILNAGLPIYHADRLENGW